MTIMTILILAEKRIMSWGQSVFIIKLVDEIGGFVRKFFSFGRITVLIALVAIIYLAALFYSLHMSFQISTYKISLEKTRDEVSELEIFLNKKSLTIFEEYRDPLALMEKVSSIRYIEEGAGGVAHR